ncbi:unnamed protein product [Citrullus colocynthis]|uniref:Uncharacterized protein n=1 Tax=Citrullus colocynthis TaxID=252529 RepID=A0ABP0YFZ9_9ROSI
MNPSPVSQNLLKLRNFQGFGIGMLKRALTFLELSQNPSLRGIVDFCHITLPRGIHHHLLLPLRPLRSLRGEKLKELIS